MNGVLLDTHVWLWHLDNDDRLPRGLARLIERSSERWLSPVSVWELALLVERGKLSIDAPLRSWLDDALARLPLREAPLTHAVSVQAHDTRLRDRDPSDRLLAATAVVHELTLLTVDPNLTEADWLPTRSR